MVYESSMVRSRFAFMTSHVSEGGTDFKLSLDRHRTIGTPEHSKRHIYKIRGEKKEDI
jgi:hypothetical protein